tara:strand:- start:2770 stop:3117 length:348 start_codon:yes stop_codon:yes gene_type:complete
MLDDYRETYIDKIPSEEKEEMIKLGFDIAQNTLSKMFGIHSNEFIRKGYNDAPILNYIRCLYFYTLHDVLYIPSIYICDKHNIQKIELKHMIKEIATSRSPKIKRDVGKILNTLT